MATDKDKTKKTNAKEIAALDFETAYARLSETAAQLEAGKLSLDESLALYEEGVALARHCEALLDKAELRVQQLTPDFTPPAPTPKLRRTLFDDEEDF